MRAYLVAAIAAGSWAAPAAAAVQTLNFDDIWGTPTVDLYYDPNSVGQFSSYAGLTWSSAFLIIKASTICNCANGVSNNVTSGDYVIAPTGLFNGDGTDVVSSPTPFQPISVQLGGVWYNNATVSFIGKLGGATVWTDSVVTSFFGPTLYSFPTGPIDTLESYVSGGSYIGPGSGNFAVWDDFTFDSSPAVGGVPEPASWAMLIAGFGLVGAAARRRRRSVAA